MSARGIPAQDVYPDWLQLRPVQEGLDPDAAEAKVEPKSSRRRRAAEEAPAGEAPAVEAAE